MNKASKIRAIIYGILIALVIFEAFDFLGGYDYIKASAFHPSAEIEAVIEGLDLTGRGERIFKASAPTLESRDDFNKNCDSHNADIYVLGCYLTADDAIHLYNVETAELSGVIESTAAHELLHAVYNRLPFWEKSSLNDALLDFYNSLSDDSDIKETMTLYSDDDFYDELHSRFGTEIKELSPALEDHYSAIFKDQDKIVDLYEQYSGTFQKYEDELKTLGAKIEELQQYITREENRLNTASDELNKKIEDYNNRVRANNYSSIDAIRTEGNNLQSEIDKINSAYDALNKKIAEYNALIDEYNNSVVRTNQIYDSINSNSTNFSEVNN